MAKRKRRNNNFGAICALVFFSLVIMILIFNVAYIGATGKHLVSGQNIKEYAEKRGTEQKVDRLIAPRGTIYSSNNEVLASDVKKYKMYAILSETRIDHDEKGNEVPAYVKDKEKTAKALAPIIGMSESDILEILNKKSYQVEFGRYGNNLSSIVKNQINSLNLPGIEFVDMTTRNYRYGDFASFEIGYAQLLTEEKDGNQISNIVGQMGLEKAFDDELSGIDGEKIHIVDNNGYTIPNGVISETAPIAGDDIYLTIDTDIQIELDVQMKKLIEDTEASKAACAVMEAKTGRILAVSNYPSFDPNKRELDNYIDLFLNEPVEPGSVFKSFVYANALTDNKLDLDEKYPSGKFYYSGNRYIQDHNWGKGWGSISYRQGFYYSSNTAICHILTEKTDKKSLLQDYEDLGFFKSSEIDRLPSAAGVAGYKNNDDRLIEYLTTGYGQGSSFTALQLLRGYSAFANNGKTVEPYFIDKIVDPQTNKTVYQGKSKYSKEIFSPEAVKTTKDLLSGVVNVKGSTGYSRYHMDDIHLIGKTGTGQIAKDGSYMSDYYTHSFAGLAPYDDPQIVVVLWYQSSSEGNTHDKGDLIKSVVRTALGKLNEQPTQEVETKSYVIDAYTNQSVEYAKKMLAQNQITPIIIGNGKTVIDQYPKVGSEVSSASRVFLQTNGSKITMPSMDGWSRKEAEAFASLANIKLECKGTGIIYKQNVSKGTKLKAGQKIKVEAK